MNIGKKLYLSFGIILATVLVLLAINLVAVQREHETKAAAQRSIDMTEATSSVRFQMMQNRLHLQNYLLSGDTRDVEKMNDGERQLSDALHHAQELANSAQQTRQPGKSAGAGAGLGQRFRQSAGGEAPGGRQRQCDRGRTADFLSAKGSELLGLAFERRSGRCRSGEPQAAGRAAPLR